jgi:hypothetical protein
MRTRRTPLFLRKSSIPYRPTIRGGAAAHITKFYKFFTAKAHTAKKE